MVHKVKPSVSVHAPLDLQLLLQSASANDMLEEQRHSSKRKGDADDVQFVPSPIDACVGYDHQVDRSKQSAYSRSVLTDRLQEIAVRNSLLHLNLFENFHGEDCNSLFYRAGNDHWNARGQAIAAGVTAAYIERTNILNR